MLYARLYWLIAPIVYVYTGGRNPSPELPPGHESEFLVSLIESWENICRDEDGVRSLKDGEYWGNKANPFDGVGEEGKEAENAPLWGKCIRER